MQPESIAIFTQKLPAGTRLVVARGDRVTDPFDGLAVEGPHGVMQFAVGGKSSALTTGWPKLSGVSRRIQKGRPRSMIFAFGALWAVRCPDPNPLERASG